MEEFKDVQRGFFFPTWHQLVHTDSCTTTTEALQLPLNCKVPKRTSFFKTFSPPWLLVTDIILTQSEPGDQYIHTKNIKALNAFAPAADSDTEVVSFYTYWSQKKLHLLLFTHRVVQ